MTTVTAHGIVCGMLNPARGDINDAEAVAIRVGEDDEVRVAGMAAQRNSARGRAGAGVPGAVSLVIRSDDHPRPAGGPYQRSSGRYRLRPEKRRMGT